MRQQIAGAGKHGGGRLVEPTQLSGISCTPAREFQSQWSEIGFHDLRSREGREATLGALAPHAIAHAGLYAASATLSLIGRRSRDTLRLKTAHTRGGVEDRAANQA